MSKQGKEHQVSQWQVIEVEKDTTQPNWTKEDELAIKTLEGHPGYVALLSKFRLQRSLLKSALANQRHESMDEVRMLQAGIHWITWLEREVKETVKGKVEVEKPRAPYGIEEEQFARVSQALKLIGQ